MEERVDIPEMEQLNNDLSYYTSEIERLTQQNKDLMKYLDSINEERYLRRLDYLFKVVESSKEFNVPFVEKVISEIEKALYGEEQKEA